MLTKSNDRFAIIDLGSNSFYMVLGSVTSLKTWKVDQEMSEAVQLRSGLTQRGDLTWESMNRALTCLDAFAARLCKFDPDPSKVRIIGTAAFRLAKNRDLFLSHAIKRLGYPIEVISGEEEAELIYQAFVHYLENLHPSHLGANDQLLGIDVGGGSTELVIGLGPNPKWSLSLPVGCVELQQYFFGKGEISAENFTLAIEGITGQFRAAERQIQTLVDFGWQRVYAGSGSADILMQAAKYLGLGVGQDISVTLLRGIRDYLISLRDYRQVQIPSLKDHQWTILPGIVAIFLALMNHLQLDKITVLPVALRHGALAAMLLAKRQPQAHNN